jgi:hypothetical protein
VRSTYATRLIVSVRMATLGRPPRTSVSAHHRSRHSSPKANGLAAVARARVRAVAATSVRRARDRERQSSGVSSVAGVKRLADDVGHVTCGACNC